MMNFNYTPDSRTKADVSLIVLHCTDGEGNAESVVEWWRQSGTQASYHTLIDRDGRINHLVDPSDIAWHSGNWEINKRSIGVSLVGRAAGFKATLPQRKSLAKVLARFSFDFELSLRRIATYEEGRVPVAFGVIQHVNVPGASHTDIAPGFPIRTVCAEARSLRNDTLGKIAVERR